MKTLDMADKYEPASYTDDDEPTVKIDMRAVLPKLYLSGDEDDFEPTLPSARSPKFPEEKRYPGIGLLIVLGTGLLFWGTLAWAIWGR